MDDDLDTIDPPHCPNCLATCVAGGTTKHPYWVCPSCRTAVLTSG
ncbi:hypothetical protein [Cryobacterium sp. TMT1-21]|nr:hypothetical protein [Cryobacterium sp. TMT1-21]